MKRHKKFIIGAAIAALLVGLASLGGILGGIAIAQQGQVGQDGSETSSADPAPEAVFASSGGAQKGVRAKVSDGAPVITGETAGFNVLAGASVSFTVPAGDTDLFVVTFSTECQLRGGPSTFDWLELEVLDNGAPMEPNGAAGDPLGICGDANYSSEAAQFVKRVGAGAHTITVRHKIVDTAPLAVLSSWIDDWSLVLEVSN